MSLPSWLQAPDVAGEYARGVQLGASISGERQRLQAENTRTNMEFQARQETQKQENLRSQAQLAQAKAYKEAEIGIQQNRLQEVEKMNALKTRNAASQMAALHKFAALKAANPDKPISDILAQVPELSTPSALLSAAKIDQETKSFGLREKQEKRLEDELSLKQNKPVPDLKATFKLPDEAGTVTGPVGQLQQRFGTNLPAMLQAPKSSAPQTTPFKEGQRVKNKKTGKFFLIKDGQPVPEDTEK